MPLNTDTLGTLRVNLAARLGFGSMGSNIGTLAPILNDILYQSQAFLWWNFDWKNLRTHVVDSVGASQTNVDFPTEIHPDRVSLVSVNFNDVWTPALERGITPEMYTNQTAGGPPSHWDTNIASGTLQIEFWPETDDAYDYRVMGIAPLGRFTADGDYCTLDKDIIFLHALGVAKAHYKQPDADLYLSMFAELDSSQKNRNWNKRVFRPGETAYPYPRPVVV